MRVAAASLGTLIGAALFAPVFCVTQHSDPGGSSTRCQALLHWLPPLRGDFAPGGMAGFAFFAVGTAVMGSLFWIAADRLAKRSRA